jgi:hypothetical protein
MGIILAAKGTIIDAISTINNISFALEGNITNA